MRLQGKTKLFLEWPIGGPERADAGLRLFFRGFESEMADDRQAIPNFFKQHALCSAG
jgi:hypothetical protein